MRHTITILKWEMSKIINNWQKTLKVFLLPALLLLAAINLFPMLMNYLSTGSLQSRPVTIVNAPDSFVDYFESNPKSSFYSVTWLSMDEAMAMDEEYREEQMKKGGIFVFFAASERTEVVDFDECVADYYSRLAQGESTRRMHMILEIDYKGDYNSYLQAEQFKEDIAKGYSPYLLEHLGQPYLDSGGGERWDTDLFNPFTFVTSNRSVANLGASRTIPSMMILLMYYCIYSLTAETLASARQSGFLTKVYLSPISKESLLIGKALMVIFVGIISAVVTFFLLFVSSWLNRSNSAYSLLPFGLFLTPSQLLAFFILLVTAAIMIAMLCFGITFMVRRMQDVIMNLQVPLVLLIFEFFGNMFRPSDAILAEYFIPIHNVIMTIREIFNGTYSWWTVLLVIFINLIFAAELFIVCLKSKDGMLHIAEEGGANDFGKSRKQKI
ncbi:MAG: ABC transporter permease [Clostridiales bacterium]|nr:ABC transporter permease [Clostridiales bacterium]